jgi:dipeptidase E
VTEVPDPGRAIARAAALVVGGGNTFALLARLERAALLEPMRQRAREGVPYLGWSAGANLACPTICTTNDMPITGPGSLEALGLVPFQINPHYTEHTIPGHGGESRDERLAEFLVLHPRMLVVGLREGSMLRLLDGVLTLLGPHPLRLFEAGRPARELGSGDDLAFLLGGGT